jgi:crotonobetainyl-CoA:carnitine CoA-transferase CaiB-like acyl-CoA transferase
MEGRSVRRAPPILGEHSKEVLVDWGVASDRIERLMKGGQVMDHKTRTP